MDEIYFYKERTCHLDIFNCYFERVGLKSFMGLITMEPKFQGL